MRHYLKIDYKSKDGSTKQKGVGSNGKEGVIFEIDILTQANARDDSARESLGTLQVVESSEGKRFVHYFSFSGEQITLAISDRFIYE